MRRLPAIIASLAVISSCLVTPACCTSSISSAPPAGSDLTTRIRALAHLNSYFNLHSWSCAADTSAADAIYREVGSEHIPLLITLLSDHDLVVSGAVRQALVLVGPPALPYLEAAVKAGSPDVARRANAAIFQIQYPRGQ